jgi:hypothetical protein
MAIDFEQECFFIAPIGEDDSPVRKRSDGVRDLVVKEAAAAHGLETRRADDFGEPGQITSQIVEHCLKAKMVVADLTGGNPNVYYELSVRHGKQLPVVLIAETDTKLPFDMGQERVIFFRDGDLSSALQAREAVKKQIGAALERGIPADNPIANGMRLAELEGGKGNNDELLFLIFERIERIGTRTAGIEERFRQADRREAIKTALRQRRDGLEPPTMGQYEYLSGTAKDLQEQQAVEEAAGIVGVDADGRPIFEESPEPSESPEADGLDPVK